MANRLLYYIKIYSPKCFGSKHTDTIYKRYKTDRQTDRQRTVSEKQRLSANDFTLVHSTVIDKATFIQERF